MGEMGVGEVVVSMTGATTGSCLLVEADWWIPPQLTYAGAGLLGR